MGAGEDGGYGPSLVHDFMVAIHGIHAFRAMRYAFGRRAHPFHMLPAIHLDHTSLPDRRNPRYTIPMHADGETDKRRLATCEAAPSRF